MRAHDSARCTPVPPRGRRAVRRERRPRKQMPNDPIQAIEFAQSKGQARKDGKTGVLFSDVAGCDEALRKLGYVVEARARPLGEHAGSLP